MLIDQIEIINVYKSVSKLLHIGFDICTNGTEFWSEKMFNLFKPKPSFKERHKLQDRFQEIAMSHGWLLDNFYEARKDPWGREINLIKEVSLQDWKPELKTDWIDIYEPTLEWHLQIAIWDVHVTCFGDGSFHRRNDYKDDIFSGGLIKGYEEIINDEFAKHCAEQI